MKPLSQLSVGKNLLFLFLTYLFITPTSKAQHIPSNERADINSRTKTQLESNNVRTTVYNFGLAGRESGSYTIAEETPFEWYKNTGQIYLAVTGLSVGAEVVDESGDTIHIVDLSHYRLSPQGETWNFEPIPGYFNQNNFKIASSNDPSTWPDFWPDRMNDTIDPGWAGSWDGYFGKNVIINGQEMYFKFSDDLYDKYNYYPDTTDLTRKGLGLVVSARAFSFNEDFLKDIVFFSYKIKNDGTKPLNKMGISVWWADFVGGDGQDDMIAYDISKNTMWSYDEDNRSYDPAFYDEPVGSIGLSFLKFPEEDMSLSNVQYIPSFMWIDQFTDEEAWNIFLTRGSFADTSSIVPGEYNAFAGTSYFSLQPGETKEIMFAILLTNGAIEDYDHSIRKKGIEGQYFSAMAALNGNFNFNAYNVNITSPLNGQVFSDNVNITWTKNGSTNWIADYLFYSTNNGNSWYFLAVDSLGSGSYNWNTYSYPDGILNKIRIISVSENGIALKISDGVFKINKNNVNALPQVYITSPRSNSEISGEYIVSLISGDADNESVEVDLFYKTDQFGYWQLLAENIQNDQYFFNTNFLPNTIDLNLKAVVTSNSDSGFYKSKMITINNPRPLYSDSTLLLNSNTPATGIFEVRITNQSELTGHDYVTVFERNNHHLTYDVFNVTTGVKLVENAEEVKGIMEGPYFEGLRLFVEDQPYTEIDSLSGWNNSGIYPLAVGYYDFFKTKRSDYRIEFGEVGIANSIYWKYRIGSSNIILLPTPVNFRIYNITENKYINFAFWERDSSSGIGLFSYASNFNRDFIFLLELSEADTFVNTYQIVLNGCESCRNPINGDIYSRYITKPFYDGDSVFFSTQNITNVRDGDFLPKEFKLEQNYPNPFNPVTRINFQIPSSALVQLEVYDILGRKIKTLINKELNAGTYYTDFNGSDFASGVYIYRLRSGNFISTKKMLLLK